jgi:hypothetical protein
MNRCGTAPSSRTDIRSPEARRSCRASFLGVTKGRKLLTDRLVERAVETAVEQSERLAGTDLSRSGRESV